MIGNYARTPIATDCLRVLEHILFLLTHIMFILSCPFQWPMLTVLLKRPSCANSQATSTPTSPPFSSQKS